MSASPSNDVSASPSPSPSSSSSSAANVDQPGRVIVEVEEEPAMKADLAEMREKVALITEIRTLLQKHNEKFKKDTLVQEFETSDRVVFRFLKARKFNVEQAAQLFKDAVGMRQDKELDGCLDKPCPKGLDYKVVSKHGWHGFDKYGRPILLKNTGIQDFKALYGTGDLLERVNYSTYMTEYQNKVIMPEANARIGHKYPIDQVVTIVSLKDFGLHCIKKHNYEWVKEIAHINNTLYPETAGSTWIINAPRVFSMVWSIVKSWLDERTRAKVQILSGDGREEIIKVIGEEAYRNLPKAIGGECTCMPEADVPKYGFGCMLGHPMSRGFIDHLKKRNEEAGLSSSYSPPDATKDEEVIPVDEKTGVIIDPTA